MRKKFFCLLFSILFLFGCASESKKDSASEKAVKDLRAKQQRLDQKTALEAKGSEKLEKKLPEPDAMDFEQMGDRLFAEGNLALSFINYRRALDLEPRRKELKYKIGRIYLRKQRPDEALSLFDEIIGTVPDYAPAFEGAGRAYLMKNDLDKACVNFLKAVRLAPENWQALTLLGFVYERKGELQKAVEAYSKAVSINPGEAAIHNNLGMALYFQGKYYQAIGAFSESLKLAGNKKTYNNLALALAKLGRYAEATEAFRKGSDESTAYNNIGVIYMREKKYAEAIQAFEKAIRANPKFYATAYENLKLAKEQSGFK